MTTLPPARPRLIPMEEQQAASKTTKLHPVSHCPNCGAPIWARESDAIVQVEALPSEIQAPPIWRSCECRPGAAIPRITDVGPLLGGRFSLQFDDTSTPPHGLPSWMQQPPGAVPPIQQGQQAQEAMTPDWLLGTAKRGPNGTTMMPVTVAPMPSYTSKEQRLQAEGGTMGEMPAFAEENA